VIIGQETQGFLQQLHDVVSHPDAERPYRNLKMELSTPVPADGSAGQTTPTRAAVSGIDRGGDVEQIVDYIANLADETPAERSDPEGHAHRRAIDHEAQLFLAALRR
jgi:hypothetical protein